MSRRRNRTKVVTKTRVIKSSTSQDKVATVMREFKEGKLKDSHGKLVTNKDQALAIALSEAGMTRKSLEKAELLNKVRVAKAQILRKLHKEQVQQDNNTAKIIRYFETHPNVQDEQVHQLADKLGIPADEFESNIYAVLSSILSVGRSKEDAQTPTIKGEWLQQGKEIEMEHTSNPLIAEKIALDHLVESYPLNYYQYLKAMEMAIEEAKKK